MKNMQTDFDHYLIYFIIFLLIKQIEVGMYI